MEDLNSLKIKMIDKEKEIEDSEKILKMYADGYTWNPYSVRKDLWQTKIPKETIAGEEICNE